MKKKTTVAMFGDFPESAEDIACSGEAENEQRDAGYYDRLIKQHIHEEEINRRKLAGEKYSHTSGIVFRTLRISAVVLTVYSLFFDLVMVIAYIFDLTDAQKYSDTRNNLAVMSAITALLVVTLVLIGLKKPKMLAALAVSLPTAVIQALVTYNWYTSTNSSDVSKAYYDSIFTKYFFCNFPVIFVPLLIFAMLIIIILDRRYETALYDRVIRRIYDDNRPEDGRLLNSEEWCEILRDYTENGSERTAPSTRRKKRSVKAQEEKTRGKMERYSTMLSDPQDGVCPVCGEVTGLQRGTRRGICLNCGAEIDVRQSVKRYLLVHEADEELTESVVTDGETTDGAGGQQDSENS